MTKKRIVLAILSLSVGYLNIRSGLIPSQKYMESYLAVDRQPKKKPKKLSKPTLKPKYARH